MNFGAVIVTYNRIDHLRRSIKRYTHQTCKPARLIVVDNASTDGTADFLRKWREKDEGIEKTVITLPENTGGSGGFYTGLKEIADNEDIDWIWVADDDAYPALDAFENAKRFIEGRSDIDEIAAVCGICGFDGHPSDIQRFCLKKGPLGVYDISIPRSFYRKRDGFDIDMYSFVGTIMKRKNLLEAGLPRKDFFIYQDDLEHALRMRKTGRIVCTPTVRITHRDNSAPPKEVSWRDYYATRNVVVMYKEHFDKWSLFWRIMRRLAVSALGLRPQKVKVVFDGVMDGLRGNMGIHPKYKPGWKI